MLAYLISPSLHADFFSIDFRKKESVSNFRVNSFLYRRGLSGKFNNSDQKLLRVNYKAEHCTALAKTKLP